MIFRIAPNFFKSIIASYSIGEGSQAYEEKRYKDAIKILKPIGVHAESILAEDINKNVLALTFYIGRKNELEKNWNTKPKSY